MPQLILVAPAAFKGTLGPRRVADALAVGARRAMPGAAVLQCPIADGGDGLLDAVLAPAALRERLSVTGPLGEPVSGELGWVDPETAIFESATACGIALLKPEQLDPVRATTRGVGELVWEAVERGAKTVVVGLGGSATVDGGTGAARGLGWEFLDAAGASLPEGGGSLAQLAEFDGGWGIAARVIALADVTTPLVGSRGAAPVFGPQKGAGPEGVKLLSRGLERLAELMARHGRGDRATLPGGGAAGGLGARGASRARGVRVARCLAARLSSGPYVPNRQCHGQVGVAGQATRLRVPVLGDLRRPRLGVGLRAVGRRAEEKHQGALVALDGPRSRGHRRPGRGDPDAPQGMGSLGSRVGV